jgi:hypothetical protein
MHEWTQHHPFHIASLHPTAKSHPCNFQLEYYGSTCLGPWPVLLGPPRVFLPTAGSQEQALCRIHLCPLQPSSDEQEEP